MSMDAEKAFERVTGFVRGSAELFCGTSPVRRNRTSPHRVRLHRTLFLSDCHLGTKGCKADLLADFLAHNDCRTLYLAGDIIDGTQPGRHWYWDEAHTRVIEEIVFKAQTGTHVVYVPGNHDYLARAFSGLSVAGIELQRDAVHQTARGTRLLVIHGDEFDSILRNPEWLARMGDAAYTLALYVNDAANSVRRRMALPVLPLAARLKAGIRSAAQFIADFEEAAARSAAAAGVEAVVCGHIHHPVIKYLDGIQYCNAGDWVENCTAVAEDPTGVLRLLRWTTPAHDVTSNDVCTPAQLYAVAAA